MQEEKICCLSDVDSILGARAEYCTWSLESGPTETGALIWFDSSWVSNGFAPAGIKLLDQMVKSILGLIFLELWHQGIVSWFATVPSPHCHILPVEPCRYFTEWEQSSSASRSDLYTGVGKQGFPAHQSSQRNEEKARLGVRGLRLLCLRCSCWAPLGPRASHSFPLDFSFLPSKTGGSEWMFFSAKEFCGSLIYTYGAIERRKRHEGNTIHSISTFSYANKWGVFTGPVSYVL